jgi:hypothetical protein
VIRELLEPELPIPDILMEIPDASIGRICVEHSSDPCPSMSVATLFENKTIPIFITHNRHDSWKTVLMNTPYISETEIATRIQESKANAIMKFFRSDPIKDYTIVGLDIIDGPLNTLTDSNVQVLYIKRYNATKDYEEFQVIAYKEETFNKLSASLSRYGETSIVSKESLVDYTRRKEMQPNTFFRLLPPDEERIFWTAYKLGYFDYPKLLRLDDLASQLGYRKSTLSIKLRRISERLCEAYFKKYVEV